MRYSVAYMCITVQQQASAKQGEEGGKSASTQTCKRITALFDRRSVCLSVWWCTLRSSLLQGSLICSAAICAALIWPYSAQCCPFGDLACFIMQITMHLPDWPCECACVCLCLWAGAPREKNGRDSNTLCFKFSRIGLQLVPTSTINRLKLTMSLTSLVTSQSWRYADSWPKARSFILKMWTFKNKSQIYVFFFPLKNISKRKGSSNRKSCICLELFFLPPLEVQAGCCISDCHGINCSAHVHRNAGTCHPEQRCGSLTCLNSFWQQGSFMARTEELLVGLP